MELKVQLPAVVVSIGMGQAAGLREVPEARFMRKDWAGGVPAMSIPGIFMLDMSCCASEVALVIRKTKNGLTDIWTDSGLWKNQG
jgi:hypothetical protein